MRNQIFLVFILFIFTVITQSYYSFKSHFSGIKYYKQKVTALEYKLKQEELKTEIAKYSFEEFKNTVASILPQDIEYKTNTEKLYPLRSLASVVRNGNNIRLATNRVRSKYQSAKKMFSKGQYDSAKDILVDIINNYSFSANIIEVYFLASESYYQLNEVEESVKLISIMIDQYPGSELTGFAMLRLGKIFENQERYGEATGIYKTVLQSFDNKDLAIQSRKSLRAARL